MKQIGPYHELLVRIRQFRQELPDILLDEAMKDKDWIIDLNQVQLERGVNSRGARIKPPYTKKTKKIKRGKGQPTDRVTLYDEGDWYGKFIVERPTNAIYVDSTDSKTEKLVTKYGEEIFGLNKESLKEFINDHLKPRIQQRFATALLG